MNARLFAYYPRCAVRLRLIKIFVESRRDAPVCKYLSYASRPASREFILCS